MARRREAAPAISDHACAFDTSLGGIVLRLMDVACHPVAASVEARMSANCQSCPAARALNRVGEISFCLLSGDGVVSGHVGKAPCASGKRRGGPRRQRARPEGR